MSYAHIARQITLQRYFLIWIMSKEVAVFFRNATSYIIHWYRSQTSEALDFLQTHQRFTIKVHLSVLRHICTPFLSTFSSIHISMSMYIQLHCTETSLTGASLFLAELLQNSAQKLLAHEQQTFPLSVFRKRSASLVTKQSPNFQLRSEMLLL